MLKEIPKSDIVIRPLKVYKEWALDETDIHPIFAKSGSSGNYDEEIEEKSYGISKVSLYHSIKSQFYTNPATSSIFTEVGRKKWGYGDGRDRILEDELAVFSIPQSKYGEGIKVGSVTFTSGSETFIDDGYSNLVYNNEIKGNIFYDRGLIVMTKNVESGSTLNSFIIEYRSTKTIYENEIFLSVLESEFNVSQNPSAVDWNPDMSFGKIKLHSISSSLDPTIVSGFGDYDFSSSVDPTGSYLAPYITTIGLYDNELNMVAVAKLPQPIKSLPDYPINFIVRLDT
jgi:hypothetical protein